MKVITTPPDRTYTVPMTVSTMGDSSKLPDGTAYYARGDFSYMLDDINGQQYRLSRTQEVALALHPSGKGLFTYQIMTLSGPIYHPLRNRSEHDPFTLEIVD